MAANKVLLVDDDPGIIEVLKPHACRVIKQ